MSGPLFATPRRGWIRLYGCDWRKVHWPDPCALVTDPPYGLGYHSDRPGRFRRREVHGDRDTRERDEALEAVPWRVAAVFGSWKVPPWRPGMVRAELVWDKGEGVGMGSLAFPWRPNFELIAVYGKGWAGKRTSSVLRGTVVSWSSERLSSQGTRPRRLHPTEKPVAVLAELIAKAPEGLPIVDPFAGSGATLEAAWLLGRDVMGAELDPEYARAAAARLERVTGAPVPILPAPG